MCDCKGRFAKTLEKHIALFKDAMLISYDESKISHMQMVYNSVFFDENNCFFCCAKMLVKIRNKITDDRSYRLRVIYEDDITPIFDNAIAEFEEKLDEQRVRDTLKYFDCDEDTVIKKTPKKKNKKKSRLGVSLKFGDKNDVEPIEPQPIIEPPIEPTKVDIRTFFGKHNEEPTTTTTTTATPTIEPTIEPRCGFMKSRYFEDFEKHDILTMLHNLYSNNEKYRTFLTDNGYVFIKIINGLHEPDALHFNAVFHNTNNIPSSVFHLYVKDETITSITKFEYVVYDFVTI